MADHMTTDEVAEACRTAPGTVRYWRHIGYGPAGFRCGRRVLYRREAVEEWLALLEQTAQDKAAA